MCNTVYRDIEKNIESDRQNCFSRNSYLCEGSFRNCVTQKFGALTYARVRELQYVNIQNTGLRKTIVCFFIAPRGWRFKGFYNLRLC